MEDGEKSPKARLQFNKSGWKLPKRPPWETKNPTMKILYLRITVPNPINDFLFRIFSCGGFETLLGRPAGMTIEGNQFRSFLADIFSQKERKNELTKDSIKRREEGDFTSFRRKFQVWMRLLSRIYIKDKNRSIEFRLQVSDAWGMGTTGERKWLLLRVGCGPGRMERLGTEAWSRSLRARACACYFYFYFFAFLGFGPLVNRKKSC